MAINKCLIFRVFLIASATYTAKADGLWDSFADPSQEARTKLWWFHGETETTKEGIDADLRAFKDAGIGGVVFYDQTHGSQEGACPALSAPLNLRTERTDIEFWNPLSGEREGNNGNILHLAPHSSIIVIVR